MVKQIIVVRISIDLKLINKTLFIIFEQKIQKDN